MKKLFLISGFCLLTLHLTAQEKRKTENVILITLDGMRWQEVFGGAEKRLIGNRQTSVGDITPFIANCFFLPIALCLLIYAILPHC